MYACRPSDMDHIGDYYYPDGLPKQSSDTKDGWQSEETDQNGNVFYICYTKEQLDNQINKWGFFAPYFPLYVSSVPNNHYE